MTPEASRYFIRSRNANQDHVVSYTSEVPQIICYRRSTVTVKTRFKYDLFAVSGLAILSTLIVELVQPVAVRVVVGLPFLILLPGYAATAALFTGRDDLNWLERLGYSFALSISLVCLTGFLLNYSRWGIRLAPFLTSLTSLIVLFCIAAYWQRQRRPPEERFVPSVELRIDGWQKRGQIDRFLWLTLVLSMVAAIAIVTYAAAEPGPEDTFTEFYVLGLDHKLGGHPGVVTAGAPFTVVLKIVNHEHTDLQYQIRCKSNLNSETIASPQLGQGETWEQSFTLALSEPGENQPVTFMLYKQSDTEPYRSLHLWITVREES